MIKTIFQLVLFVCMTFSVCFAVEQASLSSPMVVVNPSSTSTITVQSLYLNWKDRVVEVTVGDGTVSKTFIYRGDTALSMMNQLNKANLTSNSLHKRVINQLISDGYLVGTISGNPD